MRIDYDCLRTASDVTRKHPGSGLRPPLNHYVRVGPLADFGYADAYLVAGGIAWFGTLLFNSMMDGTPDVLAGAIAMIMTVFVIMGPGNYSVDQLARRAMFISARRSSRRNNRTDKHETFGYRAYTSVDRRVG